MSDKYDIRQYYFYDTKRTVIIKNGKIEVRNEIKIDGDQLELEESYFDVKRPSGSGSKINDIKIYNAATLPEKMKDYTNKIVGLAKSMGENWKRKLVVKQIATSYGYVNGNARLYHVDSINANAKTFYQPNPIPVIYDHNRYNARDIGGRVMFAHPVNYVVDKSKINDLRVPKAGIVTYSVVTDGNMVDGIMESRYLQISSGFAVNRRTATCSICGANLEDGCEHYMGDVYDGQLAYRICHDMKYKDLSYVINPADVWSKNISWEVVSDSEQLTETTREDSNTTKKAADIVPIENPVSLYLIDENDPKHWIDMRDFEERTIKDIFGNDYQCDGDICELITDKLNNIDNDMEDAATVKKEEPAPKEEPNTEEDPDACKKKSKSDKSKCKSKKDSGTAPSTNNKQQDNNNNNNIKIEEDNDPEEFYMDKVIAMLSTVASLLENKMIDVKDAVDELKESGVVLLMGDKELTSEYLLSKIDNYLDYQIEKQNKDSENKDGKDAKLSAAARKKLPNSAFCGPGRSFPVPDCARVVAARRLIGRSKYSEATKKKILACVSRKAKALGCNKSKSTNK